MRRKRRNMAMNEKPKILIADDSEINRSMLADILEEKKEAWQRGNGQ